MGRARAAAKGTAPAEADGAVATAAIESKTHSGFAARPNSQQGQAQARSALEVNKTFAAEIAVRLFAAEAISGAGTVFEVAGGALMRAPGPVYTKLIGFGMELLGAGLEVLAADLIAGGQVVGVAPPYGGTGRDEGIGVVAGGGG